MSYSEKIVTFIPVRYADSVSEAGSPYKISNRSLPDLTMQFLERLEVVERLIVCTDDRRVESFFKSSSLKIDFIYRDEGYSCANTSWDVFKHWARSQKVQISDTLLFCEITHPIRTQQFFEQLILQFIKLKSNLLVPCVYERHTFWRRDHVNAQFLRLQGDGDSDHVEALVREVLGLGTLVSWEALVTNDDIFSDADLLIIKDSWASMELQLIQQMSSIFDLK